MVNIRLRSNQFALWISWTLISVIGWAANHSALQIPSLVSTQDIMPWVIANSFDGLLIGSIITSGQWFILRDFFPKLSPRFLLLALLYPFGLIVGLLVFSFWGLADLARLGGTVLIVSPSTVLIILGVIIGMAQWLLLRSYLMPDFQSAALWVLSTLAGLTLGGLWGGSHFALVDLTFFPQSVREILGGAFTGLVSGSLTGMILLILLKSNQSPEDLRLNNVQFN